MKLAEYYAILGDDGSVGRLVNQYKKSPHYRPEKYPYKGGRGKDVPLSVTRPNAQGGASTVITAMETHKRSARFAVGRGFPSFEARDSKGVVFSLSEYSGRIVLVDFWSKDWVPWKNHLDYLVDTYKRYRGKGFDIVGVTLVPDDSGLESFIRRNGMTWRQVTGDRGLPARYGVFGEAKNFLLDGNGIIIGRNLRGAELTRALVEEMGISQQRP